MALLLGPKAMSYNRDSYDDVFNLKKKIEFVSAAQIQGFINIKMI